MAPIEQPWQAIKEWIPKDESDLNGSNHVRNPSESEPDPDQRVRRSLGEGAGPT